MAKNAEARTPGTTTVAPDVLLSIARLTALRVEGVARMSEAPQRPLRRLTQRGHAGHGVRADISGDLVDLDLHVVMDKDVNVRQVSHQIQQDVARAMDEMVGMRAGTVNIHIEDIYYPPSE